MASLSQKSAVQEFLAGWTYSRHIPGTTYASDGRLLHVHFGDERYGRNDEYLLIEPDKDTELPQRAISELPEYWLTLFTEKEPDEQLIRLYENQGYQLCYIEKLMGRTVSSNEPRGEIAEPYMLEIVREEPKSAWLEHFPLLDPVQKTAPTPTLTTYNLLHEEYLAVTATCCITPGGVACIDKVITRPDYRRRGLAKSVMTQILHDVAQAGIQISVLVASEMGQHLYQKLNYQALGAVLLFEKGVV